MSASVRPVAGEVVPAVVPATHQMEVAGVWRDALLVHEVAARLFGDGGENACERVRDLIRSRQLFALSTGRRHLIPVGAYAAYLRGERYPT